MTPLESDMLKNKIQWQRVNGDKTYRLDYDLNESSLVFDLGGYEGQWTSDIFSKYQSNIFVFEPHPEFAQSISSRFEKNQKVKVFNFGLAEKSKLEFLSVSNDSSSIYKRENNNLIAIQLKEACQFINSEKIDKIDLMKINIEGGEFDLVDHLISSNIIKKINNIQIQFHSFVPNAKDRMEKIHFLLSRTHYLTYQYKFIWENWKIINNRQGN